MDRAVGFTLETRFPIDPDVRGFPFRRELSLAPLIAAWEAPTGHDGGGVMAALGRVVREALQAAPELRAPIHDLSVIERHQELVDALMAKIFPVGAGDQEFAAAMVPFEPRAFYATPAYRRLLLGEGGVTRAQTSLDAHTTMTGRVLRAYGLILAKYYDTRLDLDYPIILTTTDPDSGLERHFSSQHDARFLEPHAIGTPPSLSEGDRRRLLAGFGDLDLLTALLPPDRFAFRGFAILRALDVTDHEILSSMERELIERESIVSTARLERLQAKLCTLLRRPDLRLGLAAIQGEQVFMLSHGQRIQHSCLFADSAHHTRADFAGSIFDRACRQDQPLVVEDLQTYPDRTVVEDEMLAHGVRSVIVAPLHYQGELIGTLKLASPNPGDLRPIAALKLRTVLPLFSMAVRRGMEELEQRVQGIIKEHCTAIHPSVEWRFRQAAFHAMERRATGAVTELEPIVFKNVHPLYAVSDIRGSSTERNASIQADLITHLRLAGEVVQLARAIRPLPILDELGYRIERHAAQLEQGLASGDELRIIAFLREHVEPRLDHLSGFGAAVRERFSAYRATMDPRLGTIYRRRKQYEESVTSINEAIAGYLDAEQEVAQAMFPHYFEKQQTDGVDYSIYVGASLVESGEFDDLYLRNLRLWQLMVTCGIARRTEALRGRLAVPLETAHLILVQHAPLAIRFRFDEKRFDVDGAYNVRYEVVKKRIDKATIRGTADRLTQPGKMAIVYSQATEAAEYRQYLDYLRSRGYLTGEVEELELEELQGVQGLRALRAAVDLTDGGPAPRAALREAAAGVRALGR